MVLHIKESVGVETLMDMISSDGAVTSVVEGQEAEVLPTHGFVELDSKDSNLPCKWVVY